MPVNRCRCSNGDQCAASGWFLKGELTAPTIVSSPERHRNFGSYAVVSRRLIPDRHSLIRTTTS